MNDTAKNHEKPEEQPCEGGEYSNKHVSASMLVVILLLMIAIVLMFIFKDRDIFKYAVFGIIIAAIGLIFGLFSKKTFYEKYFSADYLWFLIFCIGITAIVCQRFAIVGYTGSQFLDDIWGVSVDFLKVMFIALLAKFFIASSDKLSDISKETKALFDDYKVAHDKSEELLGKADQITEDFNGINQNVLHLSTSILAASDITKLVNKIQDPATKASAVDGMRKFFSGWVNLLEVHELQSAGSEEIKFLLSFFERYMIEEAKDMLENKGIATNFGFYADLISFCLNKITETTNDKKFVLFTVWDKPIGKWFNYNFGDELKYCNLNFKLYKESVIEICQNPNVYFTRCCLTKTEDESKELRTHLKYCYYYMLKEKIQVMSIEECIDKFESIYTSKITGGPTKDSLAKVIGDGKNFISPYATQIEESPNWKIAGDIFLDFYHKDRNYAYYYVKALDKNGNMPDDVYKDFTLIGTLNNGVPFNAHNINWVAGINTDGDPSKETLMVSFSNRIIKGNQFENFKNFANYVIDKCNDNNAKEVGLIKDLLA